MKLNDIKKRVYALGGISLGLKPFIAIFLVENDIFSESSAHLVPLYYEILNIWHKIILDHKNSIRLRPILLSFGIYYFFATQTLSI